jgi:hypothetical protein
MEEALHQPGMGGVDEGIGCCCRVPHDLGRVCRELKVVVHVLVVNLYAWRTSEHARSHRMCGRVMRRAWERPRERVPRRSGALGTQGAKAHSAPRLPHVSSSCAYLPNMLSPRSHSSTRVVTVLHESCSRCVVLLQTARHLCQVGSACA